MRPPQVAIDFGAPRESSSASSDEFEQVPYPPDHYRAQQQPQDLPLHYMTEDTARRRVVRSGEPLLGDAGPDTELYDDESKDVYSKSKSGKGRVSSGRQRQPPPPPPTTVVRLSLTAFSITG